MTGCVSDPGNDHHDGCKNEWQFMGKEGHMKKSIRYIIITVLLLACSGCFPLFVPVDGGGRGGGGGGHEHRDEGGRGGHRD